MWFTRCRASIIAGFFLLSACGSSVPGPDDDAIVEALRLNAPSGLSVKDVEVVASQNIGDQIEPNYRSRSNVRFELSESFVEYSSNIGDRPVVTVVMESGSEVSAELFTFGQPIGDEWRVSVQDLRIASLRGEPISQFSNPIIAGSEEERLEREELANARAARSEALRRLASLVPGTTADANQDVLQTRSKANCVGRVIPQAIAVPVPLYQGCEVLEEFLPTPSGGTYYAVDSIGRIIPDAIEMSTYSHRGVRGAAYSLHDWAFEDRDVAFVFLTRNASESEQARLRIRNFDIPEGL